MDIGTWLRALGLQQYEQAFRDNAIDGAILPELTSEDLKDIGVTPVGHRQAARRYFCSAQQRFGPGFGRGRADC